MSQRSTRSNSSLVQPPGPRLVSIGEILKPQYKPTRGDFIEVKVLWNSGTYPVEPEQLNSASTSKLCDFIFADNENHICASIIIGKNDPIDVNNVCLKLKTLTMHRISNFKTGRPPNTKNCQFIQIRGHTKKIWLEKSTLAITDIPKELDNADNFLQYIPFNFTQLKEMDTLPDNTLVDVIGYVHDRTDNKTELNDIHQLIAFGAARNKTEYARSLIIHGKHLTEITRKGATYALMNVEVTVLKMNKTLLSNPKTVIVEITEENLLMLPPQYRDKTFVTSLLRKSRKSIDGKRSSMGSSKDQNLTSASERIPLEDLNESLKKEGPNNSKKRTSTIRCNSKRVKK